MTWDQRPRDPQQQHGFDLIGATIKRRRVWLSWTQRQLEAQSGIDQTVLSRIENGKQYGLRWSRFADLVDALGGLDGPPAKEPLPLSGFRPPSAADPPSAVVRPSVVDAISPRRSTVIDLAPGLDDRHDRDEWP